MAEGVRSTCRQRYSIHRLASRDPSNPKDGIIQAAFKLPSGCFCYISHDDRRPGDDKFRNNIQKSRGGGRYLFAQSRNGDQNFRLPDDGRDYEYNLSRNMNNNEYRSSPLGMFKNFHNPDITDEFVSKHFPMIRLNHKISTPRTLALRSDNGKAEETESNYILTLKKVLPNGKQEPVDVLLNVDETGQPSSTAYDILRKLNHAIELDNEHIKGKNIPPQHMYGEEFDSKFIRQESKQRSIEQKIKSHDFENMRRKQQITTALPHIVQNYYINIPKDTSSDNDDIKLDVLRKSKFPSFGYRKNTSLTILEDILSHIQDETADSTVSSNAKYLNSDVSLPSRYTQLRNSFYDDRESRAHTTSNKNYIRNHKIGNKSEVTTYRPLTREISSETISQQSRDTFDDLHNTRHFAQQYVNAKKDKTYSNQLDIMNHFSFDNDDLGGILLSKSDKSDGKNSNYLPFKSRESISEHHKTNEHRLDNQNDERKRNGKSVSSGVSKINKNTEDGFVTYIHPREVFELLSDQSKETLLKARKRSSSDYGFVNIDTKLSTENLNDNKRHERQNQKLLNKYRELVSNLNSRGANTKFSTLSAVNIEKIEQLADVTSARLNRDSLDGRSIKSQPALESLSPIFTSSNKEANTDWIPIQKPYKFSVQIEGQNNAEQNRLKKSANTAKTPAIENSHKQNIFNINDYQTRLRNHKLNIPDQKSVLSEDRKEISESDLPPGNYDSLTKEQLIDQLKQISKTEKENKLFNILQKAREQLDNSNLNSGNAFKYHNSPQTKTKSTVLALKPYHMVTQGNVRVIQPHQTTQTSGVYDSSTNIRTHFLQTRVNDKYLNVNNIPKTFQNVQQEGVAYNSQRSVNNVINQLHGNQNNVLPSINTNYNGNSATLGKSSTSETNQWNNNPTSFVSIGNQLSGKLQLPPLYQSTSNFGKSQHQQAQSNLNQKLNVNSQNINTNVNGAQKYANFEATKLQTIPQYHNLQRGNIQVLKPQVEIQQNNNGVHAIYNQDNSLSKPYFGNNLNVQNTISSTHGRSSHQNQGGHTVVQVIKNNPNKVFSQANIQQNPTKFGKIQLSQSHPVSFTNQHNFQVAGQNIVQADPRNSLIEQKRSINPTTSTSNYDNNGHKIVEHIFNHLENNPKPGTPIRIYDDTIRQPSPVNNINRQHDANDQFQFTANSNRRIYSPSNDGLNTKQNFPIDHQKQLSFINKDENMNIGQALHMNTAPFQQPSEKKLSAWNPFRYIG